MRRRRAAFPVLMLAVLTACVTVNVYFPEAEVRDLSKQIEEEVRKQAAQKAGEEPPPPAPTPNNQGASLFDLVLGVTPAVAQVAQPEITNPAIRKIIDSRSGRFNELRKYFDQGVLGESNKGLVEVRNLEAVTDLKARADVQRLVKAENADREELYKEIAAAKNVDLAQLPKIRETYAATLRQNAKAGDWVQAADGSWAKK